MLCTATLLPPVPTSSSRGGAVTPLSGTSWPNTMSGTSCLEPPHTQPTTYSNTDSNHTYLHFTELGTKWKFPRKPQSHALSSCTFHFSTTGPSISLSQGPSGNFNQEPHHIAQMGSTSKISQGTSMARPKHIPSYGPSKFTPCAPSHTPVSHYIPSHILPHTHPTTHINHLPSLLPLAPPLIYLTHGLY